MVSTFMWETQFTFQEGGEDPDMLPAVTSISVKIKFPSVLTFSTAK